ncbi:MAG: helix-turn-helix domain-containing protein [Dehalococcoidia bacterium]|nr:helix-turn-helix domain-containing protein [Dehalococcoidia bacterium]
MERLVVSVREAAEMLGVGRATMYELVNAGEVDSITLGRRRLIPVHSLRRLVGAPTPAQDAHGRSVKDAPLNSERSQIGIEGTYVLTIRRLLPEERLTRRLAPN